MKVALITGASRGIGAATALLAARQGYAVAVNYCKNQTAAARIVSQIQDAGGTATAFQADVSRESEVAALFARIDRHWGRLDSLVNNAGILEKQMRLVEMSLPSPREPVRRASMSTTPPRRERSIR